VSISCVYVLGYRKINRSLLRYYIVVHCKYSRPYVFGRAVENGLPRHVNSFLPIWKQRARDHTRAPLIKVKRECERARERERERKRTRQRRPLCYMSSVIFPRSLRNSVLSSARQRLPLQFSVRSDKYCTLWLVIIQMARLLLNADSFARITGIARRTSTKARKKEIIFPHHLRS